ncbi:MAG: MetQ/NlpA family ABC transporter substrate-binding protein, partial [Gemmiger sp.]
EAASSEAAADFTGDGYDATVDYAALAGTTITVAASPVPHAEILNVAKDILAKADITLEIKEFTDYVQPNLVTENGEVDANYFQHGPYLENFNAENGTHLVSVAAIHYEPFGLYPGKTKTLEELADGAKIAVPNDTTNEARALQLLSAQGIITVKEGAGLTATKNDIIENPHNVEIVEMEAAQLPRTLADVDYAVINGNYAQEAGFSVGKDAIAVEDASSEAAQTYANILVVKEGNEENPAIKALAAALTSQAVKDYINATYDGAVVAIF